MNTWLLQSVKPMAEDDVRYFFVEKADILRDASRREIEYLQKVYPSYDFNEMLDAGTVRMQLATAAF